MSVSRRDFLKFSGAAVAGTVAPHLLAGASEPDLMMRAIPSSGETLPIVGLGTWQTFSLSQRETSAAVLERFVQLGGRLIDTSPMYGEAEQAIGVLGTDLGVLDDLFLATKVWTRGAQAGADQIRRSGELMRVSPIDLVQVHNLVDWRTHLKTLRGMKEAGQVRYIGITHYTVSSHEDLEQVIQTEPVDFVQINYNIAVRNADRRLLPLAADNGVAVIINRPYAEAAVFRRIRGQKLPGWAEEFDCSSFGQFFLKFILSHPAVTVAIPATSKVHHLEDNLGAARGRLPNEATRRRMIEWFEDI